ncbi:MAG TPA: hypothetical protein VFS27_07610 [Blastocatellia bacterium]|nr:hypothetical protein [Blastocatellia bacterium]
MDNTRPIKLDALTERVLYAVIQDFDLSYDNERVRSILFEGMRRLVEERLIDEEMADTAAMVITDEIADLIRAHLDRTVHMGVLLLVFVANSVAVASLKNRGAIQIENIRNYLPSEDQLMTQVIKPLFSRWMKDFDLPLRASGRKSKESTPSQLETEGIIWLQTARAKYAEMKLMNRKVYRGEFGMALGYGKGADGEQTKESAAKALRDKLKNYGYTWADITDPLQVGRKNRT